MYRLWRRNHYKNLTLVGLSIILAFVIFRLPATHQLIYQFTELGIIGPLIAGSLFVSTFTAAIGAAMLFIFSERLDIFTLSLIAGAGSLLTDLLIFHSLKSSGLTKEIKSIYKHLGGKRLVKLLKSRYFAWATPVIGTLIIASPLPDELGVSLLSFSRMHPAKFALLVFFLNVSGIYLLLYLSQPLIQK